MRFAILAILACLFLASPATLRPFMCFAAAFILACEFRDLWREMRRSSRRRAMLSGQIRGYADALQSSRRPQISRPYV